MFCKDAPQLAASQKNYGGAQKNNTAVLAKTNKAYKRHRRRSSERRAILY